MDYISRELAIKALPKHCEYILQTNVSYQTADIYRIATDHAIDVIKRLPAADVIERNTLQHTQCVESVKNALDVEEEQEITLDDVLKYCKVYRLMVISEELFNTLTLMNKLSEGIK